MKTYIYTTIVSLCFLMSSQVLSFEGQRWVWDVAFTMDSQNLFTASSDNIVRLWNLPTGEAVRDYSHSKGVIALAFMDKAVDC